MRDYAKKTNDWNRRLAKAERTIDALGKAHALLQMIAGESETDHERSKSS